METQMMPVKSNDFDLKLLNTKPRLLDKPCSNVALSEVFSERKSGYLNEKQLYLYVYNKIPNAMYEFDINCRKARVWFEQTFKNEIKDMYYNKVYFYYSKKAEYDDVFYMLDKDLMVDFDTNQSNVRFFFRDTAIEIVQSVIDGIKKFKKRKNKRKPRDCKMNCAI